MPPKNRCPLYLALDGDNISSFAQAQVKLHSEVFCVSPELIQRQYFSVLDHQMSALAVIFNGRWHLCHKSISLFFFLLTEKRRNHLLSREAALQRQKLISTRPSTFLL